MRDLAANGERLRARQQAAPLANTAIFESEKDRRAARHRLRSMAPAYGAYPASIQDLYMARGRGEAGGFTLPAVNIRGLTFDVSRALFRAMQATDAVAIFELNRAEVGFTGQSPDEFSAVVMAAAIAEGYEGPVFIQADHMMADARAFAADPARETAALELLISECIAAEFYNIDIDASTLVDLSRPMVAEQQDPNARLTARLAQLVRSLEPAGLTISIGGEIGEVGAKNSTPEELVAYVEGFRQLVGPAFMGISKASVQTGTTHGGIPLPDGSIADVALDFETLRELSRIGRERFGMAGAVQHGASTLPEELFGRFPEVGTAEVHLATGFQNLVMDHPAFPATLRQAMEAHAQAAFSKERTAGETDAQFFYRLRKKCWAPFKEQLRDLPDGVHEELGGALQQRFESIIRRLNAAGTGTVAREYVAPRTV